MSTIYESDVEVAGLSWFEGLGMILFKGRHLCIGSLSHKLKIFIELFI